MLVLELWEILRQNTDLSHPLTVQAMMRKLEEQYGTVIDRRTVKDNLLKMRAFGLPIEYESRERVNRKTGETYESIHNWYYDAEIEDIELKYLIDGLIFSKNIPKHMLDDLIGKISALGTANFTAAYEHLTPVEQIGDPNPQFFYTLEVLDEAIREKKKVTFRYLEYDHRKNPRPRTREDGSIRDYTINPYRILAANGWYYLLCNHEDHEGLSQYRVDRMTEIEILEEEVLPLEENTGYREGLKLPVHMAEHIYMFSGPSVECSFTAPVSFMQQIIDWFGKDVKVKKQDDRLRITVTVNEQAMLHWALQYGPSITVTEPASLVEKMRETLKEMGERYGL